jgi:hypothetical protein
MAVLLAVDEDLAKRVRGELPLDFTEHHGADLDGLPPERWAEEGPRQLVRLVQRTKPLVVVVGARLGGQRYLAMDAVRKLLGRKTKATPAVILLVRNMTPTLIAHAWSIGVYCWIDTKAVSDEALPKALADAVRGAASWREGLSSRPEPFGEFGLRPITPVRVRRLSRRKKAAV